MAGPSRLHGIPSRAADGREDRVVAQETPEQALAELEKNPKFAVFLKDELLKDLEWRHAEVARAHQSERRLPGAERRAGHYEFRSRAGAAPPPAPGK